MLMSVRGIFIKNLYLLGSIPFAELEFGGLEEMHRLVRVKSPWK